MRDNEYGAENETLQFSANTRPKKASWGRIKWLGFISHFRDLNKDEQAEARKKRHVIKDHIVAVVPKADDYLPKYKGYSCVLMETENDPTLTVTQVGFFLKDGKLMCKSGFYHNYESVEINMGGQPGEESTTQLYAHIRQALLARPNDNSLSAGSQDPDVQARNCLTILDKLQSHPKYGKALRSVMRHRIPPIDLNDQDAAWQLIETAGDAATFLGTITDLLKTEIAKPSLETKIEQCIKTLRFLRSKKSPYRDVMLEALQAIKLGKHEAGFDIDWNDPVSIVHLLKTYQDVPKLLENITNLAKLYSPNPDNITDDITPTALYNTYHTLPDDCNPLKLFTEPFQLTEEDTKKLITSNEIQPWVPVNRLKKYAWMTLDFLFSKTTGRIISIVLVVVALAAAVAASGGLVLPIMALVVTIVGAIVAMVIEGVKINKIEKLNEENIALKEFKEELAKLREHGKTIKDPVLKAEYEARYNDLVKTCTKLSPLKPPSLTSTSSIFATNMAAVMIEGGGAVTVEGVDFAAKLAEGAGNIANPVNLILAVVGFLASAVSDTSKGKHEAMLLNALKIEVSAKRAGPPAIEYSDVYDLQYRLNIIKTMNQDLRTNLDPDVILSKEKINKLTEYQKLNTHNYAAKIKNFFITFGRVLNPFISNAHEVISRDVMKETAERAARVAIRQKAANEAQQEIQRQAEAIAREKSKENSAKIIAKCTELASARPDTQYRSRFNGVMLSLQERRPLRRAARSPVDTPIVGTQVAIEAATVAVHMHAGQVSPVSGPPFAPTAATSPTSLKQGTILPGG
jgi:hypothetical protein